MAKGILGNWIVKNLVWAVVFVLALVLAVTVVLGVFTHHGQKIAVPDMTNLTVAEATRLAEDNGIVALVTDSVYVRRMEKGAVYSQNPKAGMTVKKGRKIRLTINAVVPKQVTMPDLVGLSMRQAKAELASRGLALGQLVYVSDIATNNVLKQVYRNREIKAGTTVPSGAVVDLVVGLNSEDSKTFIPNVVGMKYLRAVDVIHDNSLNINRLTFDAAVKTYSDSLNAVVTSQAPGASSLPVPMGQDVSLRLALPDE